MVKIACLGQNNVDLYVDQKIGYPGGCDFNDCRFARMLGAEAAIITVFGSDGYAKHNQEVMDFYQIDYSRSRYYEGETPNALIRLVDGDRTFLGTNHGGVNGKHPVELTQEDLEYLKSFDLVISSKGSKIRPEEFKKLWKEGIPLAYDFSNNSPEENIQKITPLCKFAFLSAGGKTTEETEKLLKERHDMGAKYVLASRGEEASMLFDGEIFYSQPSLPVRVVDTLGAGDSFFTAFLVAFLYRFPENEKITSEGLADCMRQGAVFAARNCLVYGAAGDGIPFQEEHLVPLK